MDIYLVDTDEEVVNAWNEHFADCEDVHVQLGDYFDFPAEAMVSPANSYGIMDGGLDDSIRERLGYDIEKRVQEAFGDSGFLEVGDAVIVSADHDCWEFLVCGPTMEEPGDVSTTDNAYRAFKAILRECRSAGIESLLCSGLATGVGRMPADDCAYQMRKAYDE